MDGLEAEGAPVETTDQSLEADVTPAVADVEDRFTDFDPAEQPEDGVTPEWLQERYKQMQGDYTRKTQAAAETARQRQDELDFIEALRSDPDTQRAVLEQLSEMLSGESDDEDLIDDSDAVDPMEERLAQLEQERATEKATALATEVTSHIEQLGKDAGFELDDDDVKAVFQGAVGGNKPINRDTTVQAFKDFQARRQALHDKWQKSYLNSKQASQQVPAGGSATDAPDLSKHENRVAQIAARLMGG